MASGDRGSCCSRLPRPHAFVRRVRAEAAASVESSALPTDLTARSSRPVTAASALRATTSAPCRLSQWACRLPSIATIHLSPSPQPAIALPTTTTPTCQPPNHRLGLRTRPPTQQFPTVTGSRPFSSSRSRAPSAAISSTMRDRPKWTQSPQIVQPAGLRCIQHKPHQPGGRRTLAHTAPTRPLNLQNPFPSSATTRLPTDCRSRDTHCPAPQTDSAQPRRCRNTTASTPSFPATDALLVRRRHTDGRPYSPVLGRWLWSRPSS